MTQLTWEHALAWRMRQHHLVERAAPAALLDIVSKIGGLHAQLMSSAELSLWARIEGLEPGTLDDALWEQRTLVKLWAMRGTLHLLPARELGMWLAALNTQTKHGNAGHAGIDALCEALAQVLHGRLLTREELALEVARVSGSDELAEWVRFSWGSYLKAPSFRGLLCFAPNDGSVVRFTDPGSWVRAPLDKPDPQAALREVARRFLSAYAPASAADLGLWWGGYGPAPGRRMLAALGDEAIEIDIDGDRAWVLAADLPAMQQVAAPRVARLLPAFDPWVAGASRTTAAVLAPQHKARVIRPQGWISPVILIDGRMTGVWKHTRKGQRLLVSIEPFEKLPRWARTQIKAEAERLATYLGGDLVLEVGDG